MCVAIFLGNKPLLRRLDCQFPPKDWYGSRGSIYRIDDITWLRALSEYVDGNFDQSREFVKQNIAYSEAMEQSKKRWWKFSLMYRYACKALLAIMDNQNDQFNQ